jgi:hypothetical protein
MQGGENAGGYGKQEGEGQCGKGELEGIGIALQDEVGNGIMKAEGLA